MSEARPAACAVVTEHLVAYVDGELGGTELEVVSGHVGTCLACRRELEGIKQLGQLVDAMPGIDVAPDLGARLEQRLAATPRRGGRRSAGWAVAFAAAAAVALALGSVLDHGGAPDDAEVAAVPAVAAPVAARPAPVRAVVARRDVDGAVNDEVAAVAELMPEDLPPELLERPELFLRLPVVRRLEPLRHFEEVRLYADPERVGGVPRPGGERSTWG